MRAALAQFSPRCCPCPRRIVVDGPVGRVKLDHSRERERRRLSGTKGLIARGLMTRGLMTRGLDWTPLPAPSLSTHHALLLTSELDGDGDGKLVLGDFVRASTTLLSSAKKSELNKLFQARARAPPSTPPLTALRT